MRLSIVALLVFAAAPARAAGHTRYVVLLAGAPHGSFDSTVGSDGKRSYDFEFNDRGRGPKIHETIELAADGTIAALDIRGNDYLKLPCVETFAVDHGRARWSSGLDAGGAPITPRAFYISVYGVPDEQALLAAALLRAPGHSLPLWPAGRASVETIATRKVSAHGETRTITQYALHGLGFSPWTLWLDETQALFAQTAEGYALIVDGWQSLVPELQKADLDWPRQAQRDLAAHAMERPKGGIAIVHANLADLDAGRLVPDTTVIVSGHRISAVGSDGKIAIPAGAKVIDARGQVLLPGLVDMHTHCDDLTGVLDIVNGVTSARDMGSDVDQSLRRQKEFAAGTVIGPRLTLAGLVDGSGPFAGPTKLLVDDEKTGRATVDKLASLGYVQLKIYSSIKPALVPALVDEAHKKGMRVSGHVPAGMTARDAVNAGFDELQHINFVFLNFLADKVKDTRTPERFTAVGENGALLDLDSPRVNDFVKLLVDKKIVVDPTLNTFEQEFIGRKGVLTSQATGIFERVPPDVRRGFYSGGLPVTAANDARYRASWAAMVRMVGKLHRAGVTLVPGTDSLPGFGLFRELELWQQAGIAPTDIVRAATTVAARVLGRSREQGTIAAGKVADLLIVDGDPLADVSALRRTVAVISDGAIVDRAALLASIGVTP